MSEQKPDSRRASSQTLQSQKEEKEQSEKQVQQEKESDQDAEKGDEQEQPPPSSVSFTHKQLRGVWLEVGKKWILTTLLLMTAILAFLSLYWTVLFRVDINMEALTVIVVDFDASAAPYTATKALVGPALTELAQKTRKGTGTLGWEVRQPSEFGMDPIAVRQYIFDEHAWAAVIVNNNATGLLNSAVQNGNASYDPLGACQLIYVEARDQQSYSSYILPQLQQFMTEASTQVGSMFTKQTLQDNSLNPATYAQAPQALSPAIGFSQFNLRPFGPPAATPTVTIGLIYLIILAFFSFTFYLPIYQSLVTPEGHPPMHFYQLLLFRLGLILLVYFFLSLAYSLVSLAFLIPFSNTGPKPQTEVINNADAYGKASFVVFWMLNFMGMTALGLASENVTMVVGMPWASLWLVFWVISNVCTAFYTIPLEPAFFKWGYAWPLNNIVQASRTILFDVHSRIGLNFGVLAAWAVINIAFFFPCALFFRYKSSKDAMKKAPRSNVEWLLKG